MKALYEPNVARHLEKWGDGNALGGSLFSWNSWIDFYKDFFATRPDFYRQFMQDQYNINGTYELNVNFDSNSGGVVKVNSNKMDLPFNYTGTYMDALPVRLTAEAEDGFTFQYWLETGDTNPEIDFVSSSNTTLTPIFMAGNCNPGDDCNDGDDCTENDVFDADCNCAGTFADDDGDGVCNADDACPGFDDNLDVNGNGVPDDCENGCTDNDDDGFCVEDDCDDNDPSIPAVVGSSCDDGNSQTENDIYLSDQCTCAGTPIITGSYCDSDGDFPWHEWIANVAFGDINNSSGKNKYSDFTNFVTAINSGATYNLSLTTGYSWETFDEHFNVWIDFNSNQVFETNELIYSGVLNAPANGTPTGTISTSVTLPAFSENLALTRMRVSMSRDGSPEPCGTIAFGEVEDYLVALGAGSALDRSQINDEELIVYPTPANDWVQVRLPNPDNIKHLSILSAAGQQMQHLDKLDLKESILTLDVRGWNAGIYFIQVAIENGKWKYGKLVITK